MSNEMVDDVGLDAVDDGATIKLIDASGKSFNVTRKQANISQFVKTALEQDPSATEVKFADQPADKLRLDLIVEYMLHHNGTEPKLIELPIRSRKMIEICPDEWDAQWVDKIGQDKQLLYNLCEAANYVSIESLLRLTTCKVATWIKGQPVEKYEELLSPNFQKAAEEERKE